MEKFIKHFDKFQITLHPDFDVVGELLSMNDSKDYANRPVKSEFILETASLNSTNTFHIGELVIAPDSGHTYYYSCVIGNNDSNRVMIQRGKGVTEAFNIFDKEAIGKLNGLKRIPFVKLCENLKSLSCSKFGLTEIPSLPKLETLICNGNELESLPDFPSLVNLNCQRNKLKQLPNLPRVEWINCSQNGLTDIHFLLLCKVLFCERNLIERIYDLPLVEEINCSYNKIGILSGINKCKKLLCYENQLKELPRMPDLLKLECEGNLLKEIPDLFQCTRIHCAFNFLERIGKIPECRVLLCRNNNLEQLPFLPNITDLDCAFNRITSLPNIPLCRRLTISHNMIRFLPNELPVCDYFLLDHNCLMTMPRMYPGDDMQFSDIDMNFDANPLLTTVDIVKLDGLRQQVMTRWWFRKWYWKMLKKKARRKMNLHEDILAEYYSPEKNRFMFEVEQFFC